MTVAVRRALVFSAVLLALHEGGRRALDALGVADRLLAGGASSLGLAALLVGFLVVRLLLWFVAPGVVIAAIVLSLPGRRRVG
jgi:hypothetical protein